MSNIKLLIECNPYLPIVNAIAPNAPIGATFITIETNLNIGAAATCSKSVIGLPRSPTEAKEIPNNTETNSTCKIFPSVSGLNTVVGIIFIKKAIIELSCALLTYSDTFADCSVLGSIFSPAPG